MNTDIFYNAFQDELAKIATTLGAAQRIGGFFRRKARPLAKPEFEQKASVIKERQKGRRRAFVPLRAKGRGRIGKRGLLSRIPLLGRVMPKKGIVPAIHRARYAAGRATSGVARAAAPMAGMAVAGKILAPGGEEQQQQGY